MEVAGLHELAAHGFPGAALEKHVVRQDHGGAAGGLEHGADVLEEVELLVRGGGPEVLAVVGQFVLLLLALLVGEGHAALLAEGRIGQHVVVGLSRRRDQRVVRRNRAVAVDLADVVQEHVHQRQPARSGDDFVAEEGFVLEEGALLAVHARIGFH